MICNDPSNPNASITNNNVENHAINENIYETIEDLRGAANPHQVVVVEEPPYEANSDQPSCSNSYCRIGNAYGRMDIIGHGIGRIERHLSSSCGSINSNHYAIENLYGTKDNSGRISKVSVQWLLANKWLPLWIANTDSGGRDYRIIDFLIAQGLENGEDDDEDLGPQGEGNGGNNVKEQ